MNGNRGRFDPLDSTAFGFTTGAIMNAIFGNLLYWDPTTQSIKLDFLASLEHNKDFTVWTAKLKPNLKFSDGTDFDAAAVVFNWKRDADPSNGSPFLEDARAMTPVAVDKTTVKMTLKEPHAHWDDVMIEDFSYIGSPTAIKAAGKNFATKPVGAGPFKLQSMNGTNTITLVRNPGYEKYAKGQPRLDKIIFQTVASTEQQSHALDSGQAQIAEPVGGHFTDLFKRLKNVNTSVLTTGGGSDLQMSIKRPPFNDPRAREAIDLALDRTAIANAFAPDTPPVTNLFPKDSPYYDPKYDFPKQNKEKAQKLFNELAAEGKPVKFAYTVPDAPSPQTTAQLIQAELSEYKNVKMTIKTETTPQYIEDQHAGKYQMLPVGLYLVKPIPELEAQVRTGGSLNTMGYSNPKVDALFDKVHNTRDPKKLKELFGSVQQELRKDHVIYWVGKGLLGLSISKDLINVEQANYGFTMRWGTIGYKK